ncbi:type III pantothenate kinase [Microbulbifer pacificus]|uniref:Type III pantothenate kinase n=1 Tax=Microbulbifer pacificus TaxID=407164 RepID=A0AAU0N1E5_9GAMM|nr:type III pantothenate kinase [Microbulbifer pacificus]WOX06777.1 type III pantothenate kinase [Microbulbifer pacificus]
MILELDQGNTRGKWRLIRATPVAGGETEIVARGVFAPGPWWLEAALPVCWLECAPRRVRVANVAGRDVESAIEARLLRDLGVVAEFARVSAACDGVRCAYAQVEKLGVDRWLAVLAAYRRSPAPALVVDCGSAVTLDLLGGGGEHLGGYIVPGLGLMRRALYSDTDAVKVAESFAPGMSLAPGTNTQDAVNRGLPLMVLGAVDQAFGFLQQQCAATGAAAPRLLLTGGDGALLASLSERPFVLLEDLVMEGLALTNP